VKYVRQVDLNAFKPDEFHSQIVARRESGAEAVCILTRVPPGKATTTGLHTHPADQMYYILKGEMTVQLGTEVQKANEKQLVVIPQGVPHYNWNETKDEEIHFEFIVPAPEEGAALATKVEDPTAGPKLDKFEFIRTLDESKFDLERFSSVALADRASGVNTTSLGIFRSPPGAKSPPLHVHRFEQIYYIISGTMGLQIGLEEFTAPANSYVILPAGVPHTNWTEGSEVLWFVNCRSPEPKDHSEPWDRRVIISADEARAL
jgi:mannose-6-phosphate isomerase-like protein (cupin superfamily)